MTCLADKIRTGKQCDRRIKLTDEQREQIRTLGANYGIRRLSREFKVDRRLIQFILYPNRREKNKADRERRGGWKQYYDKEAHRKTAAEHRQYKLLLYYYTIAVLLHNRCTITQEDK